MWGSIRSMYGDMGLHLLSKTGGDLIPLFDPMVVKQDSKTEPQRASAENSGVASGSR